MERGFLSELDEKIQKEDKPERFQVRVVSLVTLMGYCDVAFQTRLVPVAKADEGELSAESAWIYSNAFCSNPITQQELEVSVAGSDCGVSETHGFPFQQTSKPVVPGQIKEALNFIRNQDFEVRGGLR